MCTSKAPKVKPVASPPTAPAEIIDDAAIRERDRNRARSRSRNGRQSTILAGDAAPPTAQAKTVLGS